MADRNIETKNPTDRKTNIETNQKRLRRWSLALTNFQLLLQKRFTPDNVSFSDVELDPGMEILGMSQKIPLF